MRLRIRTQLVAFWSVLPTVLASGCGSETTASLPISVSVAPATVSLQAGGHQDFTATVANDPATAGVTWSLTGCTGGAAVCGGLTSVTPTTATYTAPAPIPSDAQPRITATSVTDNTKAFTVTVAITAIRVSVSPASGSVVVNGTRLFAATVDNDPANAGVTWSLTGCTGGAAICGSLIDVTSISATYTAPATGPPAALGVTATSVADNTKSFTATVAITAIGANGQIAFTSDRDGNYDIYELNTDGTGLLNLTNNGASDAKPVWSPDGSKIAFTSDRDGNQEIYLMKADGSGVVRLTTDAASDSEPAWSPDGSKIAFTSRRDGNLEIYVMNGDGSGVVRLTTDTASDWQPRWSPSGSKIAFLSARHGRLEIFVMNPDGSDQVELTGISGRGNPAWSPDGSKIAFDYSYSVGYCAIFVMNADGSGVTQLSTDFDSCGDPAWSPDGTRIAFHGNWIGWTPHGSLYYSDIYVVGANGSREVNLTNRSASCCGSVSAPAWSPAGSEIAFIAGGRAPPDIYLMSADGSRQVNLTNNPGRDFSFAWKPR